MISLVAQIIHLSAVTIQIILLAASLVGRLIIATISWVFTTIYSILESLVLFYRIIYEDNVSIFSEDILQSTNGIIDSFISNFLYIQDSFAVLYHGIHLKVTAITSSVYWFFNATVVVIYEVLAIWSKAILHVGDSLWFMLTFVPVHVPQLLGIFFVWIKDNIVDIAVNAYMNLMKLTNFLTEVPLESFLGLTSAIVIIRVYINYQEAIISQLLLLKWTVVRRFMYLYYALYNYWVNPEVRVIVQAASGQITEPMEDNLMSHVVEDNSADSLCIICQDHQKCVLTLPCRHVCLCTECCRRLYGYQRTCPICRTFISHSVTVYL